jgi:uncharacterized protein (TIGR02466 family)
MQELHLFPISIGVDHIDNFDQEKQKIIGSLKNKKYIINNKSKQLRHFHADSEQLILDDLEFLEVKNILEAKANQYYQNILGFRETLYISDSWINLCKKGGSQPDHYHSNCVVSGTLYVQIGKNYSPITFRNPRTNSQPMVNEIKSLRNIDTMYNMDWISLQNLRDGSLVFWPSYLVHGYDNNQFEDRISISFNLNIKQSDFLYSSPFTEI